MHQESVLSLLSPYLFDLVIDCITDESREEARCVILKIHPTEKEENQGNYEDEDADKVPNT